MRRLLIVLVATTPLAHAVAQTLVAPAGYAANEGNTQNLFPWDLYQPSIRHQVIYDSTHFTQQGVVGPVLISRLRYRANGSSASWAGGTWPNVQIDMSTAPVDYLAASLTYASNHGPDLTTVRNGAVVVQGGTGSTPGPWYVDIALSTPFFYDPSSGRDLVVDLRVNGALIGSSIPVDHVSAAGASPPRATRLLDIFSSSATTAGNRDLNYCPVTEFSCVPVLGGYVTFAPGCVGSAGIPSNQALALPILGQTMIAVIGNLPAPAVAIFILGFSNTMSLTSGPLPLDLAAFGAPGCFGRVSADSSLLILGAGGMASFSWGIPNNPGYLGLRFYTQALALDAPANALGGTMSDAAAGILGY